MSDTDKDPVADAISAICNDVDDHQVDDTEHKAFGSGFQLDFRIESVDREEGSIFQLDDEDGQNHATTNDDNETVTEVWGRMLLDIDELSEDGVAAWSTFVPAGYDGPLHLVYHMSHYAGEYSDDENDAHATVTMYVVGDDDFNAALEAVKAMWRGEIAQSAISKIANALGDVALLEDKELLLIADLPAFAEINRRIAAIIP